MGLLGCECLRTNPADAVFALGLLAYMYVHVHVGVIYICR